MRGTCCAIPVGGGPTTTAATDIRRLGSCAATNAVEPTIPSRTSRLTVKVFMLATVMTTVVMVAMFVLAMSQGR
jgi:hypothetical protein